MTLLEASVVVFLLQGHLAPGAHALARTLGLSGGLAAADAALEAVLLWGHGVPLFLYGGPGRGGDMAAAKWAYWGIRSATCAAVYALLLALPRTRWRDALPARPAFYRYAAQMAGVHGLAAVGAALLAAGAGAGYCAVGTANVAYFAAYPVVSRRLGVGVLGRGGLRVRPVTPAAPGQPPCPSDAAQTPRHPSRFFQLLYATFLADFFRDAALDLDLAMFSEMQDAGFLAGGDDEGF